MISISEMRVIEDAFYKAELQYYKPSIFQLIEKHFKEENEFSEASLVKLKNLPKKNSKIAYNELLMQDIKKLRDEISSVPKQFDEELWREMLPKIRDEIKKTLGMDFKPRSIFFDDSFPEGLEGFESKGASSITIFEGQEGAGIYFLNKRVSSFFTPILLIHEQIHSCLSQNKGKDQMYIEWFEEGLCQWYSMKIYYDITKNLDVLKLYKERCIIYSKVKDEHNFTRRYLEYLKLFSRFFLYGGERFIGKILVDYMSKKRDDVNSYLDMQLNIKNLPKDELDNFLVRFPDHYIPEKLPPVEYLMLKALKEPKDIDSLKEEMKLPEQLFNKVLIRLSFINMIVLKGNIAEINWRKKDLFEKNMIKAFWHMR